ncbi:MAG: hypothetical protein WBB37_08230 [bacterium]
MQEELTTQNRLSSSYTFFYKIVLPIIQLLFSAVFAFIVLLNDIQIGYIVIAIMIVVLFFSLRYSFPLKDVWLSHDHIIIKNFSHKITIPLHSIVDIKENKWFNPHYVVVKLRSDTEFGQKIIFIPDRKPGDVFSILQRK